MSNPESFTKLVNKLKHIDKLNSIAELLSWDEQVNLKPGSAELRADQLAVMSELSHKEFSNPEISDWFEELKKESLDEEQQAIVKVAWKDYRKNIKLPAEFIRRSAKARSQGYHAWVKARKENNFKAFAPHLKEHIELAKEEAAFVDPEMDAYDYMIDQFDPGMTQSQIDTLFPPLQKALNRLIEQIEASKKKADLSKFKNFDIENQEYFLKKVVETMGFDFNKGRIDTAIHPFCGGHPLDSRMTTRFDKDNPLDSLFSAVHETGHALYEQGLQSQHIGTALGQAAGMAAHESQSRLWENNIARSKEFWHHWESKYRTLFPEQLKNITSKEFYLAINSVEKNPIRVDSDEIHYNLHIILRYELEKQLFSGKIQVEDLPEAWRSLSKEYLHLEPQKDSEGCLQDVHWSEGLFGYFPSYTLGNLFAAQIWKKLQIELPSIHEDIQNGAFSNILNWLNKNIHQQGKRYQTNELCKRSTGKDLGHEDLVEYLESRYIKLYS